MARNSLAESVATWRVLRLVTGFGCRVFMVWDLLEFYAAWNGSFITDVWNNLSVSSSRVKGLPHPWTRDGYFDPKYRYRTAILCCVVSQNNADLMLVLSGGTEEHHKSPVNTVRFIAGIWTRVFRKRCRSVTNIFTLNLKNLRSNRFHFRSEYQRETI